MSGFPQTLGPHPTLDGGRWTATFDSFDPRLDHAYYLVRRTDPDAVSTSFFVRVDVWPGLPQEAWEEHLTTRIQPHADAAAGNTSYTGNPMKRR